MIAFLQKGLTPWAVSACWVQRGTMFPKFIVIKVTSRFSQDSTVLSSMVKKYVQTCCVAITVKIARISSPLKVLTTGWHVIFSRAAKDDWVGCCFLSDAVVSGPRIAKLQKYVLLRPRQLGFDMTVQEIVAGLQSATPCITGKLNVQSIGVQGFISWSTDPPLPHLLQETFGVRNDIIFCSHPFLGFHGHPLLEWSRNRCLKN
jgi:hypothetical protein